MKTELYTIRTLTNLHAGSGDINFDIVDKQVQRDQDGLPIIHSSSLKGALREHIEDKPQTIEKRQDSEEITQRVKYIFGPENNSNSSHQTGAYAFFAAHILTRPVRSNQRAYFNATSPQVIKNLLEVQADFSVPLSDTLITALQALSELNPAEGAPVVFEDTDGVKLESFSAVKNTAFSTASLSGFLGENIALFHHNDYKGLALPVLARNHLENGVSSNLWYEEVVPKQTRFYFVMGRPDNVDQTDKEKIDKFGEQFDDKLQEIVQIGANSSVGYGYTKITKVSS